MGFCFILEQDDRRYIMAKKRKTKSVKPPLTIRARGGAFNQFKKHVCVTLEKFGYKDGFSCLSLQEVKHMYSSRFIVRNPVAGYAQVISSKELKKVGHSIQNYLRTDQTEWQGEQYSPHELQVMHCLYYIIFQRNISKSRKEFLMKKFNMNELTVDPIRKVATSIILAVFKVVVALSRIGVKTYSIEPRFAEIMPDNPELEMVTVIYIYPPKIKHVAINGMFRPAFHMEFSQLNGRLKQVKVPVALLKDFYFGNQNELTVCIQSHALQRLAERLDLLNEAAINYTLRNTTLEIERFEFYNGLILLPYLVHECKVGYLVAELIHDLLVFKTFLFVTHFSTPEGDKLKEISGLGWQDISYWKIDRLSTFMRTDTEKYPRLTKMFKEAGLGDLFLLKNKKFDLETLQDANLDALRDYVVKGQQEREFDLLESLETIQM